ncbi:MAG TPA: ABC transporter permease [Gammaproteobacteria bacterium]|nr:ABC transporter permease [Gammaproteobacteria bacterium]
MLRQSLEIIVMNLRALPQRWGSSLICVIGIACVVAVFVGLFAIAATFQDILRSGADADTLLIMSEGADFEGNSTLDRESVNVIGDSSLVGRDDTGVLASFEMTRPISTSRIASDDPVNINVRGVTPAAWRVRSGFRLIEGRLIEAGRFELIAGRAARDQFSGLSVGDTVTIADAVWQIVGIFENDGGATESEVWGDLRSLQSVFGVGDTVQSARVKLVDPQQLSAFRDELSLDPRVSVSVRSEFEYIEESSNGFLEIVRLLSTPLVVVMALGAVFAALNTMYNSVAARTREIATLRAMGFRFFPVAVSVLAESLLLALAGAAIGVAVIYVGLNGYTTNSNFLSNSQYAFSFVVTAELIGRGIFWALIMGFFGGLLPAVRAGRMSIVGALRAV